MDQRLNDEEAKLELGLMGKEIINKVAKVRL